LGARRPFLCGPGEKNPGLANFVAPAPRAHCKARILRKTFVSGKGGGGGPWGGGGGPGWGGGGGKNGGRPEKMSGRTFLSSSGKKIREGPWGANPPVSRQIPPQRDPPQKRGLPGRGPGPDLTGPPTTRGGGGHSGPGCSIVSGRVGAMGGGGRVGPNHPPSRGPTRAGPQIAFSEKKGGTHAGLFKLSAPRHWGPSGGCVARKKKKTKVFAGGKPPGGKGGPPRAHHAPQNSFPGGARGGAAQRGHIFPQGQAGANRAQSLF